MPKPKAPWANNTALAVTWSHWPARPSQSSRGECARAVAGSCCSDVKLPKVPRACIGMQTHCSIGDTLETGARSTRRGIQSAVFRSRHAPEGRSTCRNTFETKATRPNKAHHLFRQVYMAEATTQAPNSLSCQRQPKRKTARPAASGHPRWAISAVKAQDLIPNASASFAKGGVAPCRSATTRGSTIRRRMYPKFRRGQLCCRAIRGGLTLGHSADYVTGPYAFSELPASKNRQQAAPTGAVHVGRSGG